MTSSQRKAAENAGDTGFNARGPSFQVTLRYPAAPRIWTGWHGGFSAAAQPIESEGMDLPRSSPSAAGGPHVFADRGVATALRGHAYAAECLYDAGPARLGETLLFVGS